MYIIKEKIAISLCKAHLSRRFIQNRAMMLQMLYGLSKKKLPEAIVGNYKVRTIVRQKAQTKGGKS
jgi:hypothetical protein